MRKEKHQERNKGHNELLRTEHDVEAMDLDVCLRVHGI